MNRPAWPLSIVPVFGVLTAFGGCGDDESIPAGGNVVTATATVGSGGVSDPDAGQATGNLGRSCKRAEDCGVDLLCLTSASHTLSRGGPPGGLCTVACNQDPSICSMHARGARCVNFGSTAYCLEVCDYGSSRPGAFDAAKCHGRTDFACTPSWISTGVPCSDVGECEVGERCEGTCLRDVPTCMPRCNSDADCGGEYCDPRSGECVASLPSGRRLAERCNVSMDEDVCRGNCGMIERREGGRCDEACTLGAYPSCGVVPEPPNVGCAIPVNEKAAFGDLGYCALLCDCTADCPDQMACVVSDLDYLQRPGFCKSPEPGDRIRNSCGNGGAGGEAGGPNMGNTEATSTSSATNVGGAGPVSTAVGGSFGQAGAPAEGGAAGAFDGAGGTLGL